MSRPAWRLLDRYLTQQMLGQFGLILLIFTLVAFFSDAFMQFLKDIQRYGLPPMQSLRLVALQLPNAIALAMPASLFLTVLLTFNALNNQFELIALRANGLSLQRILVPVVLLGLMVTAIDYLLVDWVSPRCNRASDRLKLELVAAGTLPANRRNVTLLDYDERHRLKKMLYVGSTTVNAFRDTTFIDLTRPDVLQIVQASHGELQGERWVFHQANAYTMGRKNNLLAYNHVGQLTKSNLFGPTAQLQKLKERVNLYSYSFAELWQKIQQMKLAGEDVPGKFHIRLWEKLTLPLSCLAIALTAVPLAIVPPRRGSERGFIFALVMLFAFYLVRSLSVALGQAGFLTLGSLVPMDVSLMVACLFPVVLMLGLALLLLRQKSRT